MRGQGLGNGAESLLVALVGCSVQVIARRFYTLGPEVDDTRGALHLAFSSDRVLNVDTAADWTLVLADEPWVEPFREPLSDDNRRFIEAGGRWTAHDVSAQEPYRDLVGSRLASYACTTNGYNEWKGLDLRFEDGLLLRAIAGSELAIEVSRLPSV